MSSPKVVIVGAGPAGTRAAACLVRQGLSPVVISEAPQSGGQIYRRQPAGFVRAARTLYGSETRKALALHAAFDRAREHLTYLPDTTVFNIVGETLFLDTPTGIQQRQFDSLILATGAMDRVLPVPGWTLPGVYTLGGAQVALKYQACSVGKRVVFMGTGPLLYLVAYQYAKAGAQVAAVLDTARFSDKIAALPSLLWNPRGTWLGLYYLSWLTRRAPLVGGITPLEITGAGRVQDITYRDSSGRSHTIPCDAVGLGYGLKPESQLAELAGCRLRFDETQRLWTVAHDGTGRVRPGLYVAGDCVAIGGADAAELQGELAAMSLLTDLGLGAPAERIRRLQRKLGRLQRFRLGLERAFPFPSRLVSGLPGETIACRCEAITLAEIDKVIAELKPEEPNRLKALCRAGMGRCQGRVCGAFLAEYLGLCYSKSVADIAPLRSQSPIKPLAFSKAAQCAEAGHALPGSPS